MKNIILITMLIITFSCKKEDNTPEPNTTNTTDSTSTDPCSLLTHGDVGTVTDVGGNTYNTIVIGCQEWMSENLKTTKFSNGDAILNVTNHEDLADTYEAAFIEVDNITYYTGLTVFQTDGKNVCPTGWHVPSDSEFVVMADYIREEINDDEIANALKTTTGWTNPDNNGLDTYGFHASPDGYVTSGGGLQYAGEESRWVVYKNENFFWYRVADERKDVWDHSTDRKNAVPIRCIKD